MKNKQMYFKKIYMLAAILLTLSAPLHGETVKVRKAEGRWEVSRELTIAQAEEKALNEAKKEALRMAGIMENVWSVFGQVTSENGSKFEEAYSSVSVLALNGMVNVTDKKSEQIWDPVAKKLFMSVTIDAEVTKSDIQEDRTYALEVSGIEPVYRESETFTCNFRIHGSDSYLKVFWFSEEGAAMIYPNEYEGNMKFESGKTYHFPVTDKIDLVMEKSDSKMQTEKVNIIMLATKKDFPYLGETDYMSILSWIFNLPADQRTLFYTLTLIK